MAFIDQIDVSRNLEATNFIITRVARKGLFTLRIKGKLLIVRVYVGLRCFLHKTLPSYVRVIKLMKQTEG